MDYLKLKISCNSSILDTRGLLKLGILSGDYLALSLWLISLAAKLAVYGRIDLVEVIAIYAKGATSQNIFGMPILSCIS